MIDPGVEIALIVACGTLASAIASFVSSTIAARRNAKLRREDRAAEFQSRREERAADWKRQDEVAAKAEDTARLLLAEQRLNKSRTDEVARLAAIAADEQLCQLKQVHTLVNNDKTALLQSELSQTRITLALLRRFELVDQKAGRVSSAEDTAAIVAATANIARLEVLLAERSIQLMQTEADAIEYRRGGGEGEGRLARSPAPPLA